MRIDKIDKSKKKSIIKALEAIIKANGFAETRSVINHYFKSFYERVKAQEKIKELRKEINELSKL